jgi:hypothetical protein
LRIRQDGLARLVRSGTDQRHPQIIGEKADRVQEDPLLPIGAGEHRVDLVDDQQPGAHGPEQLPAMTACSLDPAAAFGRPKRPKQLVVELILVRLRRHLKGHDRRSGDPRAVIEDRRMIAHELGDDLGLADPGVAKDQHTRHAISPGIGEEILEPPQRPLGHPEIDPAIGADPFDALVIGKARASLVGRMQVLEAHDHSSTA